MRPRDFSRAHALQRRMIRSVSEGRDRLGGDLSRIRNRQALGIQVNTAATRSPCHAREQHSHANESRRTTAQIVLDLQRDFRELPRFVKNHERVHHVAEERPNVAAASDGPFPLEANRRQI